MAQRLTETLRRLLERAQDGSAVGSSFAGHAAGAFSHCVGCWQATKKPRAQYINANNACLIEAIHLIAHYDK